MSGGAGSGARPGSRLPALGRRGEGWVALQFGLFAALAGCGFVGEWPRAVYWPLVGVGAALAAAGVTIALAGGARLGRALTPLPRPRGGVLRETGVYGRARHPIYGGVLLVAFGWALARSPVALAPAAALWPLLQLKSLREEAWLEELHPGYRSYRERVPRRFLG